MRILIEYDGSRATCEIEKNGKKVQFGYADELDQVMALEAMRVIRTWYARKYAAIPKNMMDHERDKTSASDD